MDKYGRMIYYVICSWDLNNETCEWDELSDKDKEYYTYIGNEMAYEVTNEYQREFEKNLYAAENKSL